MVVCCCHETGLKPVLFSLGRDYRSKSNKLEKEVAEKNTAINMLQNQLKKLQEDFIKKTEAVKSANDKRAEAESVVEQIKKEVAEKNTAFSELKDHLKNLQEDFIKKMEREKSADIKCAEAESVLEQVKKEVDVKNTAIEELKDQLKNTETEKSADDRCAEAKSLVEQVNCTSESLYSTLVLIRLALGFFFTYHASSIVRILPFWNPVNI